jgi:lipopolysaccharide transport system ATP-binding protein
MPLRTYSSGMQLRLAFAISTTITPEILLMDEWLSVGDENFKHKAEERMQQLADKSSILVIASHSREQIIKVCNRVIWLEHGHIKMDGDPQTVCGAYFG